MKKIVSPLVNAVKTGNWKFIVSLAAFLIVVTVGTASAAVMSSKKQELAELKNGSSSEVDLEEPVPLSDVLPTEVESDTKTKVVSVDKKFQKKEDPVVIKFIAPLPTKYMSYKTSPQGLRTAIPAVDTGGLATTDKWHNGWDIACPDKTPVYASKDGYVADVWPSYYNGGGTYRGHPTYGGLIIIRHPDNTISLYGHLSFTEVHEGDYVEAGKEIGWSGGVKGRRGSGVSTGPHLHYSIYLDMESFITY